MFKILTLVLLVCALSGLRLGGAEDPTLVLRSGAVREHLPIGSVVGVLTDSTASAGATVTYALVGGAGSTDNANFTVQGRILRSAIIFDHSLVQQCAVRVRSDDGLGTVKENAFTITITPTIYGRVTGWGNNGMETLVPPASLGRVSAIAMGYGAASAIKADGTVATWGYYPPPAGSFGDVVAVASGIHTHIYLRVDGTVHSDQAIPPGLNDAIAVASGSDHVAILKSDGTVVVVGTSFAPSFVTSVPTGLSQVIAIASSYYDTVAVCADGSLVAWGEASMFTPPPATTDVIATSTGEGQALALHADGTLLRWGNSYSGAMNIPAGLTDVKAIACGSGNNLAIRADGTVVTWGQADSGNLDMPAGLTNAIAVAGGRWGGLVSTLAEPAITSSAAAPAQVGVPFSYAITGDNVPTSFAASGLPAGLTVDTATGVVSGTPTGSGGTSTVTISATNAGGTGTATLTVTVLPAAPVIGSALAATAQVGVPFTYAITASDTPTSFAASGLPAGLTVDTATGVVSGTPTGSGGTSTVTISATNAGGTGTATLTVTVLPAAPVIGSALTATAQVGVPFTYAITASDTPTSFAASGLPAGLTVDTATGVVSGTPTAAGTSTVTISATNAGGTGTATLTVTVLPAAPVIGSALTAMAQAGVPFTYAITASGSPTSFAASGLPAGLTVATATGVVSGTPTAAGTSTVTISATNAGGTGTAALVLTVQPAASTGGDGDGDDEDSKCGVGSGIGCLLALFALRLLTRSRAGRK